MTPAIGEEVVARVAAHFGPKTLERGLACARDGRVVLVRAEWPVVARVRGERGHVVTVHYTRANRHMRGECTCGVEECEHAAAAALVAVARERDTAGARNAARAEEAVGTWLSHLGLAVDARATPRRGERDVVAYVIAMEGGGLAIAVHRTTLLRRGGYGASSVIASLTDPLRGPPTWIPVEDMRRISLLRAMTRAAEREITMRLDLVDGALLADLAASGRLFWDKVGTAPLAYGPARARDLVWREEDGGVYRAALGDGAILAPAHDPHYIDLEAGLIGPLELGVPSALVQQLALAPPVPPSMLPAVRRSLRQLVGAVGGGLVADEEVAPAVALCPHVLFAIDEDADGEPVVEVRAQAVYGDERYALTDWDPERPAARDMVEEGRRLERLQDLLGRFHTTLEGRPALLAEARHAVQGVLPALADEGWSYEVAADFPAEPSLVPARWIEKLVPIGQAGGWFSLELGVVIGGRTVSLLPLLLDAIRGGELPLSVELLDAPSLPGLDLRLPDGELVHVPGERLRRWLRPLLELELRGLDDDGLLAMPAVTAAAIAEASPGRFAGDDALTAARAQAAALLDLAPRAEEPGFGAALRTYQQQGLAWLHALHGAGMGGLLADDMGLGKTVQVLAFLDGLRAAGALSSAAPALVVAPRSVIGHWEAEALRFAPALQPLVHLGAGRATRAADLLRAPLCITSYQTMQRDADLLATLPLTTVILDEAQALKNPKTGLRRAAATLRARSRFCVTGTPLENHLGELWSQIDLVMPGFLGGKLTFEVAFRRPIEKYGDGDRLDLLRQRVRPFMLRRTKDVVAPELPPRTEIVELVELDTAQRDLYESLRLGLDADVRAALRARGVQGASLVVLDALLRLRQCCCDPRLLEETAPSAKLERLIAMLDELRDAGRSVLVFSQFTSMLRHIEDACRAADLPTLVLTGQTRRRDDVVRDFQAGACPILLVSLKAGGTGLNLTRADTVIHYDPWWNPAAEDQASDRAHRIGQTRSVFIYKLVARGTLEERILDLQRQKRALTSATLHTAGASHLAATDLAALYDQLV
ncbi:MAG TPA: DEAD/DEAH box helicase [Kofleriaceae bacterium]|nr:DEAD/DEAH box helicase [Kofleriaceae bacterium]